MTLITSDMQRFLRNEEFLYVGTANDSGKPSVAPKFLIKIENDFVYLADFVMGATARNIRSNPQVALSVVHMAALEGYIIHGTAEILESGTEYDAVLPELDRKEVYFSASRIIESMHKQKKNKSFEVAFPKEVAILKVKAQEIIKIYPSGKLEKKDV